jgi:hypothetical protein
MYLRVQQLLAVFSAEVLPLHLTGELTAVCFQMKQGKALPLSHMLQPALMNLFPKAWLPCLNLLSIP